ncbi:MAG: hypothetical protein RBG13Loki_2518 [Promethearchaeota archaeon CR_4]|nr:MAG: hypothetical protein RBG13Loki_2518 [Candidatus Lokiarchaeota archaeon CR_4]
MNLIDGKITGGEKNEYCSNLVQETLNFIRKASVSESRLFFQRQVSSLFSLLKSLLEILPLDEQSQSRQCQAILKDQPLPKLRLWPKCARFLTRF